MPIKSSNGFPSLPRLMINEELQIYFSEINPFTLEDYGKSSSVVKRIN
jgi:hypothetical protein